MYHGKFCGKMERPLNGLPSRKCKWKEYLKSRCDWEQKTRLESDTAHSRVKQGPAWSSFLVNETIVIQRDSVLPADFKRWWRFSLAYRLSAYTGASFCSRRFWFCSSPLLPFFLLFLLIEVNASGAYLSSKVFYFEVKGSLYNGNYSVFFQLEI